MSSNRPALVCATDFSERAILAASAAAKIAAGCSELLRVVHVSPPRDTTGRVEGQGRLELEARRLSGGGVVAEAVLLEGDKTADTFLEYLQAERPSLVVVGSQTQGAVDRWALGSFSEQVAETSPVPTLVLRNPAGLASWGWSGRTLKVLVALDLQAGSEAVLRWVKDLGRAGPIELVPCHVRPPVSPSAAPADPPELQQQLQRELRRLVRDQLAIDVSEAIVVPPTGEPGEALIECAWRVHADLVVVGTHRRHGLSRLFHGSVSRRLLHEAGLNVACVPTSAEFDPRGAHIPEYRRVLVATDLSPLGNAAIPFACGACSIGGLVRIVHVAKPSRTTSPVREELHRRLLDLIPAETGARCQPPDVVVLEHRTPAVAICAEAERFGADLVCLSSHGLGGSTAFHGSVARAVLRKIRRPVLIIRRPED